MSLRADRRPRIAAIAVLAIAAAVSACSGDGVFKREYEYEEELYLALDGSATLNVNASVDSLNALRGATFNPDPVARVDRDDVRRFFGADNADVSVSLARRDGRRFVHATVEVDNVEQLSRLAPFSWSQYQLGRRQDAIEFRQHVGKPAKAGGSASWTGEEIVAFRMHLPSEIMFHNSDDDIQRGNILEWEQPLSARLAGEPVDIEVQLEPTSILAQTLLLFGSTAAVAIATLAGLVWWISRRGKDENPKAQ
jgi:hypothetical protein